MLLTATGSSNVEFWRSSDYGQNYSLVSTIDVGGVTIKHPSSISFADSNIGYASGGTSIYKTTNGGSTWSEVAQVADPTPYTTIFYSEGAMIYAGKSYVRNSYSPTWVQSNDGGATWSNWNRWFSSIKYMFSLNEIMDSSYSRYTSGSDLGTEISLPKYTTYSQSPPEWINCWVTSITGP